MRFAVAFQVGSDAAGSVARCHIAYLTVDERSIELRQRIRSVTGATAAARLTNRLAKDAFNLQSSHSPPTFATMLSQKSFTRAAIGRRQSKKLI